MGIVWKFVIYCTKETKGNVADRKKQGQKKRRIERKMVRNRQHKKKTTILWHLVVKVLESK